MLTTICKKQIQKTLTPERMVTPNKELDSLPTPEEISFQTQDHLLLHGHWFQGRTNQTVIFSHSAGASRYGWKNKEQSETIDWKPSIEIFIKHGYNVLVFDQRACGESEGSLTGFGSKEALDVLAAFHWVRHTKKGPANNELNRFVFIGFSTGANATLNAIHQLEKEENIRIIGILSNLYWYSKMFPRSVEYFTQLPKGLAPYLSKITSDLVGFSPDIEANPLRVLPLLSSPILLVNSKADRIADVDDIKQLYASINSPKQLILLDGERFDSYHVMEKEAKQIFSFIEEHIGEKENKKKKIAVLTIEYQNSWTTKGFFHHLIKKEYQRKNVYEQTLFLLDQARMNNCPVIHAPLILDKQDKLRYKKAPFPAKLLKQLTVNSWKSELTKGIYKKSDTLVEGRSSYDACVDSNLLSILEQKKIEVVILTGFTTDHCVKETCESLEKKGIQCIIAEDCTATLSRKKEHWMKARYPMSKTVDILDFFHTYSKS